MKNAEAFLEALNRRAKIFARSASETFESNRETCEWLLNPLARWAELAYGDAIFDKAAQGYVEYCIGVARAKQIYEKEGRYTPESFPEIVSAVYDHEGYMVPYMWAAVLIYAFWPSMVNHIAMFRDDFVRRLPRGATVLEMAAGHGVLSLLAAEERPDIHVEGVDISEHAVAVATRLLAAAGHKDRVCFRVDNALRVDELGTNGRYQGIISAMLAEHLSDPQLLFSQVSRGISADGVVFFSTALESPQRDHVFEYNRESQPLLMAESAGLRVSRLISDSSMTTSGSRFVPRAAAMILRPHRASIKNLPEIQFSRMGAVQA